VEIISVNHGGRKALVLVKARHVTGLTKPGRKDEVKLGKEGRKD